MRVAAAVVVVLLGCTAYEVAVAVRWISMPTTPGAGPAGSGWVLAAALVAMLVALVSAATSRRRSAAVALAAPAAAAFVVARFSTFDPYYLPTLRRASDGGLFPPWWVYGLAVAAVAAGALTWIAPRIGKTLAVPVLLVCLVTAWAMYAGH